MLKTSIIQNILRGVGILHTRSENNVYVLPFYSLLVQYFYHLNFKIVHFCYFQNTFPFVSTFRETGVIRKQNVEKSSWNRV